MTFRKDARLDPGQVTDLRGQGGGRRRIGLPGGFNFPGGGGGSSGGGMGLPLGGGIGLVVLIVIVIAFLFLNGGLGGGSGFDTSQVDQAAASPGNLAECRTGEDANARLDCRIVGFVNSIQAYWGSALPQFSGRQYPQAKTTLYDGGVSTACGEADSSVGPFYCPVDQKIYIDLGFFNELTTRFGASAGPLAQAYVVAHEYGHHIQNTTGVLQQAQSSETGPQSPAVRVELQADCYAGVWTANAVGTGYLEPITDAQLQQAISAAQAVGDDRIQRKATGQVSPESWTHGSAEQRQRWFTTGYNQGDPRACDTFSGTV